MAHHYLAYTAAINPPGASPVLNRSQIWKLLERKIVAAEEFVPGALKSTDVISTSTTPHGNPVTTRDVVFHDASRGRVREIVTTYEPCRVLFHQPGTGSDISNIISVGPKGEGEGEEDLWMTYVFEWRRKEGGGKGEGGKYEEEEIRGLEEKERKLAVESVESTIRLMREMVREGKA